MLTICVITATLPQASVAVQVRRSVCAPAQAPLVVFSVNTTVTGPPQTSAAFTVGGGGMPSVQSIVKSAGALSNTGATGSVAVRVCVTLAVFPQASVAVQVRCRV